MFQGGFTHAGASLADGPTSSTVSWTFSSDVLYEDNGLSPVVGGDGTIYLYQGHTGPDGHVRVMAISPTTHTTLWSWDPRDGAARWRFEGSSGTIGLPNLPAVSPDGKKVYFTSGGGKLYALSAGASGGRLAWKRRILPKDVGVGVNPTVVSDPPSVLTGRSTCRAVMGSQAKSKRSIRMELSNGLMKHPSIPLRLPR